MTAQALGVPREEAPAQDSVASAAEARNSAASGRGALQARTVPLHAPTLGQTEERANKWAVLALVGSAAFMTTLDSSIVNISLPSIASAPRDDAVASSNRPRAICSSGSCSGRRRYWRSSRISRYPSTTTRLSGIYRYSRCNRRSLVAFEPRVAPGRSPGSEATSQH
jgi:hypothetical protein